MGAWAVKAQPLETQKRQVPVVVPLEKAPELPAPTKSNTQPFSIGAKLPPYQPAFANPSEKGIDFTGKSNLVHRKIELNPRTNNFGNQKEDYKAVKGDQFFGDFTNNGDFVNVYCRDFAAIDGDRVSIFVNGVELPTLKNYSKILDIEYLKSIFRYDEYSDIHGDLTIENIIGILDNNRDISINKEYGEYYFIDPNTGNIHDSPLLDYAKLLQSLHGNYEFLMTVSDIKIEKNHINFMVTESDAYVQLYQKYYSYLKENFSNREIISIFYHEIIHWLRLLPYKIRKNDKLAVVFYTKLLKIIVDVQEIENDLKK